MMLLPFSSLRLRGGRYPASGEPAKTNSMGMRPSLRKKGPAGWSFWLLLAAWLCANSPQSVAYSLITWAMRSQHFTHQERLKADVARLLTGKGAPPAPRLVESVPARPVAAPVPAEADLDRSISRIRSV